MNAVACYARLHIVIEDLDGTYIVNPTDGAVTITSGDRFAGIQLAANTLQEPTIFSIVPIPFTGELGKGPLNTKLDQYRGFYEFQKVSANNLPLLQDVVVGVCAPASLSAELFARLRLGHNASGGFRIEPPANADFLNCASFASAEKSASPAEFFGSGLLGRVTALFTPRVAFAASGNSLFAGGGVGGLASELSPFAPVDATVSFAGGIGGLASELRILTVEPSPGTCSGQAPAGNAFDAACRPKVTLTTLLGTPLAQAPVTFEATVGNGLVALQDANGICGPFATVVTATTLADGSAQVCWTLGSVPGRNRLRAVGGVGGDVPPGTTYADARFFTATGNAPTGFVFLGAPASGDSVVAGVNIPVRAALVDAHGTVFTSYSGQVTLGLRRAGAAATFAAGTQTVATAANGVATFSPVSITAAGIDYSLRATGTYANTSLTSDTGTFSVVAASAASITKVLGDNQIATALSVLPVQPTVLVSDVFGNPVSGAGVTWTTGGTSGGSVFPLASTTGGDGRTSTVWTVGSGNNELLATTGALMTLFRATGNAATLSVLNQCLPTGGGDPFNDPAKPFAFFIPDPGNGKTIREITLFISSAGQANDITRHDIRLTLTRNTFNPADTSLREVTATTFLRGNNSETKGITFTLLEPIIGASGQGARRVMMRLSAFGASASTEKLSFNTGACSPNSTRCSVPNICKVTEVSSPLPYPLGTFHRQSVGITVRGN